MIDLQALVDKHPELLRRVLAGASGPLGEVLLAQRLERLGYRVDVLNSNARQRDLKVISPAGVEFFVETKTLRAGGTWWVNTPPDPSRSSHWFFIIAAREADGLPEEADVRYFVVTTEEALIAWGKSSPAKRNPHIGDVRKGNLPPDCEGAFHKLPA